MYRIKILKIFFIILVSSNIHAFAQSAIGIDIFGIGHHPFGNKNYRIYENSVSDYGTWVIEPGLIFSYQKFIILTHTSLQFSQGLYSDAAAQFAGFSALYLKRKFFHKYKHSFSLAVGGAYLFRDKWSDISGYIQDYDFNSGNRYEYKYGLTAELKYYFYVSNKSDIDIAVLYGHQFETFTFSIGYRYWINTHVNFKDKDCKSCGDKKFRRKPIRTWIRRHIKI